MKSKKIIKKNKKAMPIIIMSFLYDLLFVAVTVFALLSFIKTIDSGLQLWRQRYADDLSTTLTLIEGMPDNVSVTYGQKHTKFLSNSPVELFLDVANGMLSVSSLSDPSQKTERQYVSEKDSNLEIHSPLQSFTIIKSPGVSKISASDSGCEVLVPELTNLIETKVFFGIQSYTRNAVKNNFEDLIENLQSNIEFEYSNRLSSHPDLKQILFNKNIKTANPNSNIVILFSERRSEVDTIKVLYLEKGNALFAKQISCFMKKYIEHKYGDQFDVQTTSIPNNYVTLNSGPDTSVILIQFETKDKFNFLKSQESRRQFSILLSSTIFEMTKRYDESDLQRLLNDEN